MVETAPIKVSVLANGDVLLDTEPVSLDDLRLALQEGAKSKTPVWYYRENAAGEPPPVVTDVLKLITSNRLPVRLCAQPDFSDNAAPASILEQNFATIREKAAQRKLVITRPDFKYLLIPIGPKEAMPANMVASAEGMLSSKVPRKVAVIGETAWAAAAAPTLEAANEAIPFFGYLLAFATIGHAVWVFEARDNAAMLAAGCREADVLLVDSARETALPHGWKEIAAKSMRNPQILVHDRETYRLRQA